mmetsp:Transcript_27401/g.64729  ORF Transcript_27401/g.64729 Transcript_27401/m.64729 type:complete len:222 (-) Transcript_27401:538-1203(-)
MYTRFRPLRSPHARSAAGHEGHTNARARTTLSARGLNGLEALDELLQPGERVSTAAAVCVVVVGEEQVVELIAARPADATVREDVAALLLGLLAPHRVGLGVDAVERTGGVRLEDEALEERLLDHVAQLAPHEAVAGRLHVDELRVEDDEHGGGRILVEILDQPLHRFHLGRCRRHEQQRRDTLCDLGPRHRASDRVRRQLPVVRDVRGGPLVREEDLHLG